MAKKAKKTSKKKTVTKKAKRKKKAKPKVKNNPAPTMFCGNPCFFDRSPCEVEMSGHKVHRCSAHLA